MVNSHYRYTSIAQKNLQSVKVILHEVYDVANLIIKVNSNYD